MTAFQTFRNGSPDAGHYAHPIVVENWTTNSKHGRSSTLRKCGLPCTPLSGHPWYCLNSLNNSTPPKIYFLSPQIKNTTSRDGNIILVFYIFNRLRFVFPFDPSHDWSVYNEYEYVMDKAS